MLVNKAQVGGRRLGTITEIFHENYLQSYHLAISIVPIEYERLVKLLQIQQNAIRGLFNREKSTFDIRHG